MRINTYDGRKMNSHLLNNKQFYKNNSLFSSNDNGSFPNINSDEIPDFSSLINEEKKKVFRNHNHIYFRCGVTMSKVNTLCNLIEEYNREQDILRSEFTTGIFIPKPIYLHITSWGGDLLGGFLAYDYIKNSKIPVYTIAEGYAVSSGANMFMAGHKRFMTESSYILVHQLNITKNGQETFHDMIDETVNVVELMRKSYSIYLNNIRHHRINIPDDDILTKEKLENHMLHDIYWNYETCVRFGIVDELYTNYADTDIKDIRQLLQQETNMSTQTKIYSLHELLPSKIIVDKIKKNIDQCKQNDALEMIKNFIEGKDSTNLSNGLINNNHKRKIDDLDLDSSSDTIITNPIRKSSRISNRQNKQSKRNGINKGKRQKTNRKH